MHTGINYHSFRKPALLAAGLALAGLCGVSSAQAQTLFNISTSESAYNAASHALNSPHVVNVLYSPTAGNQSGNTVTGYTQPQKGGFGVNFTSPSLLTSSGGQADVDIASPFSTITLTPTDPAVGFSVLEFRPEGHTLGGDPYSLMVTNQFGATETLTGVFDKQVQDFFGIIGLNGDLITKATLTSSAPIEDLRQVRIAACNFPPIPGPAVPEASTTALAMSGMLVLLPLGLRARRRQA